MVLLISQNFKEYGKSQLIYDFSLNERIYFQLSKSILVLIGSVVKGVTRFVYLNSTFDGKTEPKQCIRLDGCLFSNFNMSNDYACDIFVNKQDMNLLVERTIFRRLTCLGISSVVGEIAFVWSCNDFKFITSCFEDTRHANGAQSFGLDSYSYNIPSSDINETYY